MMLRFFLFAGTLLLAGCTVEQTQPAVMQDNERWGHLPPDPERPQQAELSAADEDASAA